MFPPPRGQGASSASFPLVVPETALKPAWAKGPSLSISMRRQCPCFSPWCCGLSCWDEVKSVSSAPYWINSEFIGLGHERGQLHSCPATLPTPCPAPQLPLPLNWSTLILLLHWSCASWSHSGIHEPQLYSEDVVTCGLWRASIVPLHLALLPLGRVHWCLSIQPWDGRVRN